MWEMLTYPFFRNAIAAVLIISVAAAIIGTYIVARRMVAISGGITHACFGGLGLGYYLGINPLLAAAVFAIGASMGVEWMESRQRIRQDSAIAVVWALGMAIGIFFVFLTPGYVPELNTFLFGNVITIAPSDLWAFAIYTVVLIAFMAVFYRQVLACAFDKDFARVMHMPVRFISYSMTILVAVCIVLTIRLVGVMLLMSMLALPQIISETFTRRFHTMMLSSIAVSATCCLAGLMLSAVIDVPCSALIVLIMVGAYVVVRLVNAVVRSRRKSVMAITIAAILAIGLSGCSLKKNTAASRNYTAFITRYNIYFNGDEHYKETLKEMERKYEDDYSQILYLHPTEAHENERAPQPTGDFTRSIEKAQKAIQLRSIKKRPARKSGKSNNPEYKKWLQREEYNPFLHNAWMMMARSQYMNGDFLGSAATFYYVSKHFWWLPATVTEAKLWQARCYCACDWLFEAESILKSVSEKDIAENSTLEGLYYFDYADLYVKSKEYAQAIPYLQKAIGYAKGSQKTRLTFLLGQLYENLGQKQEAYDAFRRAGSSSGASYRTKFNARIKQSEVYQGANIEKEVKALKAMTRFGSNKDYLDQIYYAIGNLYLSRADTTKAIPYYEKAIKSSTRNGIDKALAQITLGKIYYDMQNYDKAQPCFAEAIPLLPETYPDYRTLKHRSDVLDELAVYSQNVTLQDSLLKLSMLSPEEQHKVAQRLVDELNKREKEEAEAAQREAYLQQQAAAGTGLHQGNNAAPTTFNLNTDKSWYFYNEGTRNAGRTEFQKRWGSRRLEDDWRRRNKASYSVFDDQPDESDQPDTSDQSDQQDVDPSQATPEAAQRAADPHYPEYYLRQIPRTDAERATANDVIQEGLYNMGVILKDKMDDFPAAEKEFNRLLTQYPDNAYRLDTYYNMYLMYMRAGQTAEAEKYRQLIMTEFPDSRQGEALADPEYMEKLLRMPQVEQGLYDEAYQAYMNNDNARVHAIYQLVRKDYPMSRIMPKFMFLEALSYVTENNPEQFAETLRQLTALYPETDVAPLANDYLRLLDSGRKLNSSGSNVRGMQWSTRLSNSTSDEDMPTDAANFDFETDGPHLVVFIYSIKNTSPNQLLFDVARHNFNTFTVKDFDLEQMKFGDLGLLVVSGFDSQAQAIHYRSTLEADGAWRIPPTVVPLIISKHNFDLLINEGRSLDEYFDAAGDDRLDRVHNALATDDAPILEPAEPTEATKSASPDQSSPSVQLDQLAPLEQPTPEQKAETPASEPTKEEPSKEPIPEPTKEEPTKEEPTKEEPEEEYDYDIPIPVLPLNTPPVAPHL